MGQPTPSPHGIRDLNAVAIASLALAMLLLCGLTAYAGSRLLPQLPFALLFLLCLFGPIPLLGLLCIRFRGEAGLGQAIFLCCDSNPYWYRRTGR